MRIDLARYSGLAVATLAVSILTLGCKCADKRDAVWIPKPSVNWEQVSTLPVQAAHEGFRVLVSESTLGLFPVSMGVTRVAIEVTGREPTTARPVLLTDPRNEFLQWNSQFDDLMAVSEVFPIVERDLGGRYPVPEQIVAAFQALHVGLGLIYAVNELSESETEMFGVLYDVNTAQPIASLHAWTASPKPSEPGKCSDPVDLWKSDSRALVREKFGTLVHACIRHLITEDQPVPAESPSGWTPAGPIRPVVWPPRVTRAGR